MRPNSALAEARAQLDALGPLARPSGPDRPGRADRFKLETWGELRARPLPAWIIRGVVPAGGVGVTYGASGSGKTMLVTDFACCVALGRPWRGRRVKQGAVLYIAAEAGSTIRLRFDAWRAVHLAEEAPDPPVRFLTAAPDLYGADDLPDLMAAIQAVDEEAFALIVVDTVARVMGEGDENAARDMGMLVRNLDRLARETGAAVLAVHHSGKDSSKGARGSSALRAAVDVEIEVEGQSGTRVATMTKVRDGEAGAEFAFELQVVEIGTDEEGAPVTSCAAVPAETAARKGQKVTGQARMALDLLHRAIADEGQIPPACRHIPRDIPACPAPLWRSYCYAGGVTDSDDADTQRKAFNRVRKSLLQLNAIGQWEEWVWPTIGTP